MADQATGYINQNTDVVNDASARMAHVVEMMPGVTTNVTAAGDSADAMTEDMKKLNEHLYVSGNISAEEKQQLDAYNETIENSSREMEDAADRISGNASQEADQNRTDTILQPVGDSGVVTTMTAGSVVRCEQSPAYRIRKSAYTEESAFPGDWEKLATGRITLEDGYYYYLPADAVIESYQTVYNGQEHSITSESNREIGTATTVFVKKATDTSDSVDAAGDAGRAAARAGDAMGSLYKEYMRILEGTSSDVHKDIEDALEEMEDAMDALERAQASVNDITSYLNAQDDLQMIKADEEWDRNVDSIHEQMDNISAVM